MSDTSTGPTAAAFAAAAAQNLGIEPESSTDEAEADTADDTTPDHPEEEGAP